MDEVLPGLDETRVAALHSLLNSHGGRVFLEWLAEQEQSAISYLRTEDDETELRRAQGDLRTIQAIADLFEAVQAVSEKEPVDEG